MNKRVVAANLLGVAFGLAAITILAILVSPSEQVMVNVLIFNGIAIAFTPALPKFWNDSMLADAWLHKPLKMLLWLVFAGVGMLALDIVLGTIANPQLPLIEAATKFVGFWITVVLLALLMYAAIVCFIRQKLLAGLAVLVHRGSSDKQ